MREFLLSQGISKELLNDVDEFIETHDLNKNFEYRIPKIKYKYYGINFFFFFEKEKNYCTW